MRARWFSSPAAKVAAAAIAFLVVAASCTTKVDTDLAESADSADVTETTAADPTPTGAPAPTSEPQSTFDQTKETRQVATAIRQIDFENGFTYDTQLGFGPGEATVVDGTVENGELGTEDYYFFAASLEAFGDLDGDGVEEAVVQTTWNGGGTGFFDSVRVYRLVDGQAQRAGAVDFGDRAFGGVVAMRIEDGLLRVWSFADGDGACCPTQIAETTLLLGEHTLVEADRTDPVTWMSLDPNGPDRPGT